MPAAEGPIERLGAMVFALADQIGGAARMGIHTITSVFVRPFPTRELIDQIRSVGAASVPLALYTAVFIGAVMALQFGHGLKRFGAGLYTGKLVGLAYVMELGPVLTSILVGGRVGAGITAELGSMKVSEQIDAIRVLGADPVRVLVMPRVLACLFAVPVLCLFADVVGILGGMLINSAQEGISWGFYLELTISSLTLGSVAHGIIKSVIFGFLIGLIACYRGFETGFGTEGVGRATTETVVHISIVILAADLFLTNLLLPYTKVFNDAVRHIF